MSAPVHGPLERTESNLARRDRTFHDAVERAARGKGGQGLIMIRAPA